MDGSDEMLQVIDLRVVIHAEVSLTRPDLTSLVQFSSVIFRVA